jgi:hypothetical protein
MKKKKNVMLTLNVELYQLCKNLGDDSIRNFSAFMETCLRRHVKAVQKKKVVKKELLPPLSDDEFKKLLSIGDPDKILEQHELTDSQLDMLLDSEGD